MWKVSDEDTTIYLLGTIHLLPKGIEWYDGKLAQAFEQAQELVTEIPEIPQDQTVAIKPMRANPGDAEVLVRTEVKGGAEPVPIDYRLEKAADAASGWRIYNLNVAGIWLVDTYRTQFGQEINAKGIDGLITALADRNKAGTRK